MSELTDDRLREIVAGCEGVRPGPWHVLGSNYPSSGTNDGHSIPLASGYEGEMDPLDAAHIARLDPDTVKAICTELLALRAAASTSTEGAGVKAAADQLLAALQRYGFPVSDAAVRPLMDGGSLEAQAVHVAAMQLRAKLNPPAPKVTT